MRPDRFTLLLAAIAFLGAALSLARQVSYGPGLEWDGVVYISVARNLLAGDGLVSFDGKLYTLWPPLYPMLLAAAGLGALDPYAVAGPLNAIIFGLTVFVAGRWLRHRLETRLLALWGCLAIALWSPLVLRSSYALSEPVFILLTTLALIQADKYLDEDRRSALVWAGVFTALAWLARYMGVAVVVTVGLLLISQRGAALPKKLRRAALYSLIAAAPMAVWMVRNFLTAGTLTGENRLQAPYPLTELMNDLTKMSSMVIPGFADGGIRLAAEYLAGLVLAAFAAAVVLTFIRGRRDWRAFYLFGGFALASIALYFVALLMGATWHGVQGRHLMPLYIPLLLTGLFALDRFVVYVRSHHSLPPEGAWVNARTIVWGGAIVSMLGVVLASALCLWLAYQAALTARGIVSANQGVGLGLAGARWERSEVLRRARELPAGSHVFSDSIAVVYIHTGQGKHIYPVDDWGAPRVQAQDAGSGVYVVWIDPIPPRRDRIDKLTELLELDLVAELSDGAIYRGNSRARLPPAYFTRDGAPMVGESFGVSFSGALRANVIGRAVAMERGSDAVWLWERGSDAVGWTELPNGAGPSYEYTPTAADVGHRLRVSASYTDGGGNWVETVAGPSEPVLKAAR